MAFVHGMERAPEDPGHIQASACCKHYAANSMEHTTEGGQTHTRHNFDANISMQDLVDSYLAPFQAGIEKGQVSGLMCRLVAGHLYHMMLTAVQWNLQLTHSYSSSLPLNL